MEWLVINRPPEPERLAVCHGDFHWLNILFDKDRVTGVLDWPNFVIADPVFDVATTMMLITVAYEYVASCMGIFPGVDWEYVAELYLGAYRRQNQLDGKHLEYYRVKRCVEALVKGSEGQKAWREPSIRKRIVEYIRKITGIIITAPADWTILSVGSWPASK